MRIRPEMIIVTSNYLPSQCFSNEEDIGPIHRRFRVIEDLAELPPIPEEIPQEMLEPWDGEPLDLEDVLEVQEQESSHQQEPSLELDQEPSLQMGQGLGLEHEHQAQEEVLEVQELDPSLEQDQEPLLQMSQVLGLEPEPQALEEVLKVQEQEPYLEQEPFLEQVQEPPLQMTQVLGLDPELDQVSMEEDDVGQPVHADSRCSQQ